ncbi:nucleoside-diphosphate sugar epimerase [Psychromonas marina]|uniref:Nucleoside-diphosphate sugar epimerase n=1 Tax=Psychromonas marina TaxID=88364 RepID=A0ABQ6E1L3_9GAMM|nr:NAD(P)H-binding protein [Psychromonas marina]GLS91251.1 nucleoside-diphosphate sugar epimerase [Psychromonas marina]
MQQKLSMIIAGASGLVGQATLIDALKSEAIDCIYCLSRTQIEIVHPKLTQWIDPELTPPTLSTALTQPTIGVIALGTTIKKAGSKKSLYAIDVTLVVKVAKQMQQLGVQRIIIVSCLGASTKALSHYLRCKGEMEQAIQHLGFMSTTFVQPGPLAGQRKETRKDEKALQSVMRFISPLMVGALANYKPIKACDVAKAIIHIATQDSTPMIARINSTQMQTLIE